MFNNYAETIMFKKDVRTIKIKFKIDIKSLDAKKEIFLLRY